MSVRIAVALHILDCRMGRITLSDRTMAIGHFFCYQTIGKSNIVLANSRNYWTIRYHGYQIKASIYRQCCGSGMFIPDPGSWFLPIPDPGSRITYPGSKNSNKREGWKKIWCNTFLFSHKFHKIVHYFSFEVLKEKNLGQFSKNYRTFCPKNCH